MTGINLLITGASIVTFDDQDTQLSDGAIAIVGNKITWLGTTAESEALFLAKETINAAGLIDPAGMVLLANCVRPQFPAVEFPTQAALMLNGS